MEEDKYNFEMTDQQKVSAIKRINERTRQIERKFGKNSPEYRAARERLEVASGGNLTKGGLLSHGKKQVDALSSQQLYGLLESKTAAELQKGYVEGAKQEFDTDAPSKEEVERYRDLANTVRDLIKEYPDKVSEAVKAYDLHGPQSSASDWAEAMNGVISGDMSQEAKERLAESMEGEISSSYFSTPEAAFEEGKENYDPEEA